MSRKAFVALLVLLLAAGCGQVPTAAVVGRTTVPTPAAYPPPLWSPEPTYPPLPTMTPWPTPPTTDTPIPPPATARPTPAPTPVLPFPTPSFPPSPAGAQPEGLGTIWYPYYPSPDSNPVLRAVLVDEQGRRWGEAKRSIDLGLGAPSYGYQLRAAYVSFDGRSFVADVGYLEESKSFWIDPALGEARPVSTDPEHEDFMAWGPDQQIFVWNSLGHDGDIWLLNLATQEHRAFAFPAFEYNFGVRAIAVAPDGSSIADLSVYGPTVSHPGSDIEVGLQPLAGGSRVSLATLQISEGADVPGYNLLAWSPDSQQLAFTLLTGMYDKDSSNDDSQLWLVDQKGTLTLLAHGLSVYHAAAWSPDRRYIAFIKAETPTHTSSPANLWLFDMAASREVQLTHFAGQRVTSVVWSPDGERLAFAVTLADYGEVWLTSLDGTDQYPIAGPTTPDTPVVWLQSAEGGQ